MAFKSYSELVQLPTFEERFEYLSLGSRIGDMSFGHERFLNQRFYASREWKLARTTVIARDLACDLGIRGRDIHARIAVHHISPMTAAEIDARDPKLLDPDNLITVAYETHNAIHFGGIETLPKAWEPRRPGDTSIY